MDRNFDFWIDGSVSHLGPSKTSTNSISERADSISRRMCSRYDSASDIRPRNGTINAKSFFNTRAALFSDESIAIVGAKTVGYEGSDSELVVLNPDLMLRAKADIHVLANALAVSP